MQFINSFTQNFTLIEGFTITISTIAIIISIISFYNTAARDRRQIRINKIEEMVEIVILIIGNYASFDDLFFLQQKIKYTEETSEKNVLLKKEKKHIAAVTLISNQIKLREKLTRLNVLANSYLPNSELKNRVRFLVSLISSIYETTVNQNYELTKSIFKTYPRAWTLLPFVEKLQLELSAEMKLGYESTFFTDNNNHEDFLKELKLK